MIDHNSEQPPTKSVSPGKQKEPNEGASTVERGTPSSQPVLKKALIVGGIVAVVVITVMSLIGVGVDGGRGALSGGLGAASAFVFMGITVLSIFVSNFFVKSDLYVVWFFISVLGSWIVKFGLFIVAVLLLRDQPWLNPKLFFVSLLVGVVCSLVLDVIIVTKSRLPYVGDLSGKRAV
ncbi:hypothetical protein [Lysinibacter sp. HNR]|uniref:hypothetical protein n=1 Tax=Lysinibacter sp. HNR TaxID=3031408 RepID=UPI0024353B9C|nr:hypothetical protein [Lysinibacter sp. HNR]WGD36616.1 hypothetical protein FrondiHNR_09105 [Lysinibacter sp. HNR]